MSKHKYQLAMDIGTDEIQLVKVLKVLDNGLLETDGYNEDVTHQAVQCVIRHMAIRCEEKGTPDLTYEIPSIGKITFTPPTKEGSDHAR